MLSQIVIHSLLFDVSDYLFRFQEQTHSLRRFCGKTIGRDLRTRFFTAAHVERMMHETKSVYTNILFRTVVKMRREKCTVWDRKRGQHEG
jgi:hypothetical protein